MSAPLPRSRPPIGSADAEPGAGQAWPLSGSRASAGSLPHPFDCCPRAVSASRDRRRRLPVRSRRDGLRAVLDRRARAAARTPTACECCGAPVVSVYRRQARASPRLLPRVPARTACTFALGDRRDEAVVGLRHVFATKRGRVACCDARRKALRRWESARLANALGRRRDGDEEHVRLAWRITEALVGGELTFDEYGLLVYLLATIDHNHLCGSCRSTTACSSPRWP